MDTLKDKQNLDALAETPEPPWAVWLNRAKQRLHHGSLSSEGIGSASKCCPSAWRSLPVIGSVSWRSVATPTTSKSAQEERSCSFDRPRRRPRRPLGRLQCAWGAAAGGDLQRPGAPCEDGVAVDLHEFRDGYFPYSRAEVKDVFEALKGEAAPDLILTHHRQDLHQDHRLLCELTWNTFRDHLVLEYEIPKYDADLGHPNVFVPVTEDLCRRKIDVLLRHFGTSGASTGSPRIC
jgi:hypothetical protein